jgi:hypothetical protein
MCDVYIFTAVVSLALKLGGQMAVRCGNHKSVFGCQMRIALYIQDEWMQVVVIRILVECIATPLTQPVELSSLPKMLR